MKRKRAGFTLVELMVTVAIAAILIAVAVPSYRQYVRRANRTDATSALLRLASNQERFYLQNNTYASDAQLAADPPGGLGITGRTTDRGFYDLSLDAQATGDDYRLGYTATATIAAGGNQADDTDCATFTINEQGVRGATSGGATSQAIIDRCWR